MIEFLIKTSNVLLKSILIILILGVIVNNSYTQCPPTAPTPFDNNSTGPSWIILEGDNPGTSLQYRWYSSQTGGTPLSNPNSQTYLYTTPLLIENDTFYVSKFNSSCPAGTQESPRARAIAYIDPAPYPDNSNHEAFGDQQWYVYCYNDTAYNIYSGYYIDTDFNINSTKTWGDSLKSPNYTTKIFSYQGGKIQADFHSIRYKKQNFPSGIYRIDINNHDDYCELWINGEQILNHKSYGHPHFNAWTGPLNSTSTVEFKWLDYKEASIGRVTFTQISQPTNLQAGIIPDSLFACVNQFAETLSLGTTINAYKDAYTDSGSPSQNFGNGDINTIVNPKKYIYLTFDISKIKNVDNADLVLTSTNVAVTPNTFVSLYGVSDTTWQESQLNWNNQPSYGQYIDSTVISDLTSSNFTWDITNYLKSEIAAGRKKTTVLLKVNGTPKNIPYVTSASFYSKESSKKPHLVINGSKRACSFKTFQWQSQILCNGVFSDISQANNDTFTPPIATQKTCYRLQLIDECGNIAYSDTTVISISNPNPPTLSDTSVCKNSIITLKAIGTADSYNWYTLASNGNLVNTGIDFQTSALTKDTSFFVAGVDGNCVGDQRSEVKVSQRPESIAGTLSSDINILCGNNGNKDTIRLTNYSGSIIDILSSNDNFNTNQSSIASGVDKVIIKNLTTGMYYKAIVKNGLCKADTSAIFNEKVNYNDPGKITVAELSPEKGVLKLEGYSGQIIRWETSDNKFQTLKIINNTSSDLTIDNTVPLYFRAIVQAQGCPEDKSDSIQVGLIKLFSSFSPNGDNINETWIIDNIESTNNNVTIFNRWGELVFEINNYDNLERVWKGTSNKGSHELPDGTYFYVIKVENDKPISGYIILKR